MYAQLTNVTRSKIVLMKIIGLLSLRHGLTMSRVNFKWKLLVKGEEEGS